MEVVIFLIAFIAGVLINISRKMDKEDNNEK